MKSGTSSLRDMLRDHPGCGLYRGEIHYFDNPELYARGEDWYHGHFTEDPDGADRLWGDKSPSYSLDPEAPGRIHDYNPDAGIVWILREPVARTISNFHHAKKRNIDAPAIEDAIGPDGRPVAFVTGDYLYRSQYERHLAAFDAVFPPEQQKILLFEEVLADPAGQGRDLAAWLGLDPGIPLALPHSNEGRQPMKRRFPVPLETRLRMAEVLAPTVAAIEARLGREIPAWHVDHAAAVARAEAKAAQREAEKAALQARRAEERAEERARERARERAEARARRRREERAAGKTTLQAGQVDARAEERAEERARRRREERAAEKAAQRAAEKAARDEERKQRRRQERAAEKAAGKGGDG